MSYDIYLVDPLTEETIVLSEPHQFSGGTYALGGTTEAWLNVTYNYGVPFRKALGEKGIRSIYGLTGAESVPVLRDAAAKLGDDVDDDYWKATEGNAKHALVQLLGLAMLCPNGVWKGD